MLKDRRFQLHVAAWVWWCAGLLCCSAVFGAVGRSSPQFLRQTIVTLHRARVNIVDKQLKEEKQSLSGEIDRKDFQLFLSYLDGRIYYYCDQLEKNEGRDSLADLPCPVGGDGSLAESEYGSVPEISARGEGEQVGDIENGFTASLGEFDDMLLKEQEQIAAHVPRERGESGGGSDTDGGGKRSGDNGKGGKGKGSEKNGEKNNSTGKSAAQGSGSSGTSQTGLPPTRGNRDLSRNDDDIVAKQLREAAEQETDPEVKAKLWEEYRKYKGK
ncbi:MAG: hypothetical protein JRC87_01745 [Deltaproteobacteria bacterium]|nr:hypothetical protein [Deltaproteobacteria bacterium]